MGLTYQESSQDPCYGPQAAPPCPLEEVRGQQQKDDVLQQHHLGDQGRVTAGQDKAEPPPVRSRQSHHRSGQGIATACQAKAEPFLASAALPCCPQGSQAERPLEAEPHIPLKGTVS